MDRQAAIAKASIYRHGRITILVKDGTEHAHDSISAAKRFVRGVTNGKNIICVEQQKGENLFRIVRDRIASELAEREAKNVSI